MIFPDLFLSKLCSNSQKKRNQTNGLMLQTAIMLHAPELFLAGRYVLNCSTSLEAPIRENDCFHTYLRMSVPSACRSHYPHKIFLICHYYFRCLCIWVIESKILMSFTCSFFTIDKSIVTIIFNKIEKILYRL